MNDSSGFKIVSQTLEHAKDAPQLVVDIGASEGEYTSNSLGLIQDGWEAILIEPNPVQFAYLNNLHKQNPKITFMNVAVCHTDEQVILNGHPNDGDGHRTCNHGASLLPIEGSLVCWRVQGLSYKSFVEQIDLDKVGLLCTDAEGFDFQILQGILTATTARPKAIVTEAWERPAAEEFLKSHGYRLVADNNCDQGFVLCK